jgi:hypothetical protein
MCSAPWASPAVVSVRLSQPSPPALSDYSLPELTILIFTELCLSRYFSPGFIFLRELPKGNYPIFPQNLLILHRMLKMAILGIFKFVFLLHFL